MRGILINSEKQTITEVEHNGDYRHIYELCGFSCFTILELGDGEVLYLDDEGLLKNPEFFFELIGPDWKYPQLLAGNALILGSKETEDGDTDSDSSKLDLATVARNVRFTRAGVAGWTEPKTYNIEGAFVVQGAQPIFGPPEEKEKD